MVDTREKAIKLFTYLKELSALGTTQIKDIEKYEQVIWFSDIPEEKGCHCIAWELWNKSGNEKEERGDLWVEVSKPVLKSPPEVPDDLALWIKENEIDKSSLKEPELFEEILETLPADDETGEERTIVHSINDHPEILDLWVEYVENNWRPWAEEDRRLQQIQRVYNDLFTIYQRAEKLGEQYEVIVGIGFFLWHTPNSGKVHHHVLSIQGRIEFDPKRGIMSVGPAMDGPQARLETDMLETEDRPSVSDLKGVQSMVDELDGEPWDAPSLEAILKSLANGVSTKSKYESSITRPIHMSEAPQLHFAPAIILRKRTHRTYVDFYNNIIEQLKQGAKIQESVQRLVEVVEDEYRPHESIQGEASLSKSVPDTELYFPLPVNDEQKRIAHIIEQRQGVLVQGPPGTGKSHTIANLIAHFLAKGKRILVTSETPRALEVLKKMLPQEISELCVIWLGAGPDAQKSLEKSVQGITQQKNNWDPMSAVEEIKKLEEDLDTVRRDQARLSKELTAFREADTYQHNKVFNIYSGTLEKIAIRVNGERDQYGWMLDRPGKDDEPRVNSSDLLELVRINRQLTEEMLQEIELRHLSADKLIPPVEFRKLVDIELRAQALHSKAKEKRNYPGYKSLRSLDPTQRIHMLELLKDLLSRMSLLSKNAHGWVDRAAREIAASQDRVWRKLLDLTKQHINAMEKCSHEVSSLRISGLDGYDLAEVALHAEELLSHLNSGRSLGFGPFRKKPVKQALYLIKKVRVEGKPGDSAEVLQKLMDRLDFKKRLDDLAELWKTYTTPPQGEDSVRLAEYQNLSKSLSEVIKISDIVHELNKYISGLPELSSPHWHFRNDIEALCNAVEAAYLDEGLEFARKAFAPLKRMIEEFLEKEGAHPATQQVLDALLKRDTKAYEEGFSVVSKMNKWVQEFTRKRDIFTKLQASAPKTAEAYGASVDDDSWDEKFNQFESAWIWAKTDRWINDMCNENKSVVLNEHLEALKEKERVLLRKLAAKKAWQHCIEELHETERQALIAWKQAVENIRLGTGRHAETHRETARRKLAECRKAIPAWIMPLYQVVQTIGPQVGIFDIVIVDEASQSGPEALLLSYIGEKIIVVGDDKQIKPLHIGINRDQVDYLRRMHLKGIPHNEALGLEGSLFSQTELRFPGRVRLREHFRCMPEIIQFSNNLSYSTEPLIPLRQHGAKRLKPVEARHVEDGYRKGRSPNILNEPEAKAIVEQIVKCCEDPDYENKEFGVISLLGYAQSTLIGNLLISEIGAAEIEKRRLHCGIPYDFQGDERHVIFLSMVDAPEEGRICRMVRDAETQRRFNVAASRAKDQLWLFHSPTLNDLRPDCLRYRLLKYCLNPSVEQSTIGDLDIEKIRRLAKSEARDRTKPPDPFDSWFEVDVFLKIAERGYRIFPQYEVAGYSIDLVIEGLEGRLAVECDGDEWHGPDKFMQDKRRERELVRCGWTFCRIKGSEFYRDSEKALTPLWEELEALKIWPQSRWGEPSTTTEFEEEPSPSDSRTETEKVQNERKLGKQRTPHKGRLDHTLHNSREQKKRRRPEDLPAAVIQNAIIDALKNCPPHFTCQLKSITKKVLKELGIITRGSHRVEFDKRIKRNIGVLKRKGLVIEYKSKFKRLRLLATEDQKSLL